MTFTLSCDSEPERNWVIERFMRTLTGPYLYQHRVDTLEQTPAIIALQPAMPREPMGHRTPVRALSQSLRRAA